MRIKFPDTLDCKSTSTTLHIVIGSCSSYNLIVKHPLLPLKHKNNGTCSNDHPASIYIIHNVRVQFRESTKYLICFACRWNISCDRVILYTSRLSKCWGYVWCCLYAMALTKEEDDTWYKRVTVLQCDKDCAIVF